MKRMLVTSLLLVAVLALLVGCGGNKEKPADPADQVGAAIEMKPQKPVVGEVTEFRVTVTEPSVGVKLDQANVAMFLEMKEMDHGENRVALTEVEPGVYQGTGTFPMKGIWIAHIRTEKDGRTRTANVELNVE